MCTCAVVMVPEIKENVTADICPSQNVSTVCMYDHAYVYYPHSHATGMSYPGMFE
jgi:hypothetical protein